ncbi:MAG: hypothetical protein JNK02_16320 [Planctomycetes bacterium]|nr:hypothetical protein [Planctomycetota bacterium]
MATPDPDLDGASSRSLERGSVPITEPPRATTEVPVTVAELEPWREGRIAEVDRQLGVLAQGKDPMMRQTDLQYLFAICISPIADEMGLSERTIADNVTRRVLRNPQEHLYTFGNREYRIPEGLFPAFDEYQRVWTERDRRLSALPPAEAARGLPDPWPLDPSYLAELGALAARAKAAILQRSEAY